MAKYRYVYTEFWNDPDVLEKFTPEDKLFYLYLLTNRNTSQIGIYEITRKQMSFELGYSLEAVNAMMERFINKHQLILYDEETREICIKNWAKYNLFNDSKPIADAVANAIAKVRNATFLRYPAMYAESNGIKELFDCDTEPCPGRGEKENKSKLKESKRKDNAHLENEIESDFEEWWNLYDKKLDKKKSLIVFKKCHKEHGYEKILEGTKAYLQTVTDKQYQRYPTTFLNNQSYLDIDEFKNIAKQKMSKLRGNDGIDLNSQYEKDLTEHLGF